MLASLINDLTEDSRAIYHEVLSLLEAEDAKRTAQLANRIEVRQSEDDPNLLRIKFPYQPPIERPQNPLEALDHDLLRADCADDFTEAFERCAAELAKLGQGHQLNEAGAGLYLWLRFMDFAVWGPKFSWGDTPTAADIAMGRGCRKRNPGCWCRVDRPPEHQHAECRTDERRDSFCECPPKEEMQNRPIRLCPGDSWMAPNKGCCMFCGFPVVVTQATTPGEDYAFYCSNPKCEKHSPIENMGDLDWPDWCITPEVAPLCVCGHGRTRHNAQDDSCYPCAVAGKDCRFSSLILMLETAQGRDLDKVAVVYGVERRVNETDASVRGRCEEAQRHSFTPPASPPTAASDQTGGNTPPLAHAPA